MPKKYAFYLIVYAVLATGAAVYMTHQTATLVDLEYHRDDTVATSTPACPTLEEQLAERAYVLREENKAMDLEKYRQEAIREVNIKLQEHLANSPFISYDDLEAEYGY